MDKKAQDLLAQTELKIKENGFTVIATLEEESGRPFAYSVGLHDKGKPELIIFGLPPVVSAQILNSLAQLALEKPLEVNVPIEEVASVPLMLKRVPNSASRELMLVGYTRTSDEITAYQVLWSDKNGKFPYEMEFSKEFTRHQPALYAE